MSAYADNLHAQLDYQCSVNAVLLATTRPKGRTGPLLTSDEMKEMDAAFTMGLSPKGFAAILVSRDKAKAATDTEILERLIAIGEVGPVRFYHSSGWCYDGHSYPDARSALAVFMERTAAKAAS